MVRLRFRDALLQQLSEKLLTDTERVDFAVNEHTEHAHIMPSSQAYLDFLREEVKALRKQADRIAVLVLMADTAYALTGSLENLIEEV